MGTPTTSAPGPGESRPPWAGDALGGGVEAALVCPWTAKVEYLYVDLGRSSAPVGDARFKANTVRAGVNYRF